MTDNRFAPGVFATPSAPASVRNMLLAQTRIEVSLFVRNGEQLLLALFIPAAVLIGLTLLDIGALPQPRVQGAITAVLAVAVMSTAFTGQAISVGFDRRYGALKRLGATPLTPALIIGGKTLAVIILIAGQCIILGSIAVLLGWRPSLLGLLLAVPVLIVGTMAFSSMGLLLGGTLKAEIVLGLANLIWFILLGAAGMAVGVAAVPGVVHNFLMVLPSYALAELIGQALAGSVSLLPIVVLVIWTALCSLGAAKWFSFT